MPRTLNGTRVSATLLLRQPPLDDPDYIELRSSSGLRAFLHRRVVRDAFTLTRLHVPNETGALLMGGTFTDGTQPFTIVTDLVMPLPDEVIGTSATVTITAHGRRRMEIEGRLHDQLASPIGWMHSHPVQMAFFSGTDELEQAKWTGPASVGLVVSGRDDADPRYCVFLGADAEEAVDTPTTRRLLIVNSGVPGQRRRILQRADMGGRSTAADAGNVPGGTLSGVRTFAKEQNGVTAWRRAGTSHHGRTADGRPGRGQRGRALKVAPLLLLALVAVMLLLAVRGGGSGSDPVVTTPANPEIPSPLFDGIDGLLRTDGPTERRTP